MYVTSLLYEDSLQPKEKHQIKVSFTKKDLTNRPKAKAHILLLIYMEHSKNSFVATTVIVFLLGVFYICVRSLSRSNPLLPYQESNGLRSNSVSI